MRDFRKAIAVGRLAEASIGAPSLLRRALIRQVPLLALAALIVLAFRDHLTAIDWRSVSAAVWEISLPQWLIAAAASYASYRAIGQYDAQLHRWLSTGVADREAVRSGMAAIAISQTAGFGLLTGSLMRFHMVPSLSLAASIRLTVAVTASFLAAWSVLTALAFAFLWPADAPQAAVLHMVALANVALVLLVALRIGFVPHLRLRRRFFDLLPLRMMARILALALIDCLGAAAALYVFLPPDLAPDLAHFLPAFLLALGVGLMFGTPGGVGPFEVVLATLLPGLPLDLLATALICFRAIYFALPAAVAAATVALAAQDRPRSGAAEGTVPSPSSGGAVPSFYPNPGAAILPEALALAPSAEYGLFRQGAHRIVQGSRHRDFWLTARAGQRLVALLDPSGGAGACQRLLPALAAEARAAGLTPCLYKIGPRTAAAARAEGWAIVPVAEDHWLRPRTFTTAGSARATLRRKLRHAAEAGVTVTRHRPADPAGLPFAAMEEVNRDWSLRHGGERGFSMGRFAPSYLSGQRLYLGWKDGRLVAFASFHAGQAEWALDLMRQRADTPDGTMQTLIVAALEEAAALGLPRLSLAACSLPRGGLPGLAGWLADRVLRRAGAGGLRQFKAGFAPHRTRLYLATPRPASLPLAVVEIACAVRHPAPLPQVRQDGGMRRAHGHVEKLGFDVS
ncbi:phosphatidylglycerol lysyltransferase domain-containing protein [Frigidibacter sp. RF13]|uniref:phosphatidylglycerol lysyltransferase domain-containing protein n=1 Tax=Frigidibacter sp. RF13 TaxID=2997340 RepID=UPI0022717112|nr:phosphatidylglycerol lysyltransferase domain-containing protein [Frigidibacter sp. RF13]MCY1128011.1 phosphatidylglycerol lysyltransferase domain-containing protein [Frigidibacter sp. RF13]